ncbi:MAG TPA: hypothetical protein VHJ19_13725 [Gammaproteobacteria bacterium]|nr:hypothetical protein [Gammaproteobacteria bacterium]
MSWRTARRAKDSLGIKPAKTRFDGGWTWALPAKMTKMAEDVHPTTDGHLGDKNGQETHWNAASSEDGHVATFEGAHPAQDGREDGHGGHLRQNPHPKAIFENKNAEDDQPKKVDTFGEVGRLRESEAEDHVEVFEVPE